MLPYITLKLIIEKMLAIVHHPFCFSSGTEAENIHDYSEA